MIWYVIASGKKLGVKFEKGRGNYGRWKWKKYAEKCAGKYREIRELSGNWAVIFNDKIFRISDPGKKGGKHT